MEFRTGLVALIGKPNVGKSTLLNAIVGQKVSIVSDKPQTTRRRVTGIATTDRYQIIFVDTPGIHEPHTRLQKSMVEHSRAALADVDAVLFVVDGSRHPGQDDVEMAKLIRGSSQGAPVILCMNKMDRLKAENVEAFVEAYCGLAGTEEYMLTTATQGRNIDKLVDLVVARLPVGDPIYPEDEFTDQSSRFLVGEIVREKILAATRQEVPHATAVLVDQWTEEPSGLLRIGAAIIVERASQRGILIGKGGQFLKQVGTQARLEIENLLGRKIFLELTVKVREGWRMNPRMLQELEYTD